MSKSVSYRRDIDGLRGVAVLSVVLYHYGASWLPGGFTGVDIFFVISGFLITSIVRAEIEQGTFSLRSFYARRIRRIFPALSFVAFVSLIAGWLLLMPGDFIKLGQSAAAASIGVSNIFFYLNTGYFDQAASLQPLLHTWSLGVEEQFYLVWPLGLLGLSFFIKPLGLKRLLLLAVVVGGFVLAVRQTSITNPKAAFYLLPARAWELALGGLVVFLPRLKSAKLGIAAELFAAALLLWSLLRIDSAMPFPGLNASFAVFGAALLVWPKQGWLGSAVLSSAPLVGIGLLSYSLYLWHWPVLVFSRHYANGWHPNVLGAGALIALSLALSYVTWRWVERPFRRRASRRSARLAPGAAALTVLVAGITISGNLGFQGRAPSYLRAVLDRDQMWQWDCPSVREYEGEKLCYFGRDWDSTPARAMLFGDSHAEHLAPTFNAISHDTAFVLEGPCLPSAGTVMNVNVPEEPRYRQICAAAQNRALKLIKEQNIGTLILSGSWTGRLVDLYAEEYRDLSLSDQHELFRQGLTDFLGRVDQDKVHVIILGDTPWLANGATANCEVAASFLFRSPCSPTSRDLATFEDRQGPVEKILDDVATQFNNVDVIHIGRNLCSSGTCISHIDGEPLYRDGDHFRRNLSDAQQAQLANWLGLQTQ